MIDAILIILINLFSLAMSMLLVFQVFMVTRIKKDLFNAIVRIIYSFSHGYFTLLFSSFIYKDHRNSL
jgi:hypothetical protein